MLLGLYSSIVFSLEPALWAILDPVLGVVDGSAVEDVGVALPTTAPRWFPGILSFLSRRRDCLMRPHQPHSRVVIEGGSDHHSARAKGTIGLAAGREKFGRALARTRKAGFGSSDDSAPRGLNAQLKCEIAVGDRCDSAGVGGGGGRELGERTAGGCCGNSAGRPGEPGAQDSSRGLGREQGRCSFGGGVGDEVGDGV